MLNVTLRASVHRLLDYLCLLVWSCSPRLQMRQPHCRLVSPRIKPREQRHIAAAASETESPSPHACGMLF